MPQAAVYLLQQKDKKFRWIAVCNQRLKLDSEHLSLGSLSALTSMLGLLSYSICDTMTIVNVSVPNKLV